MLNSLRYVFRHRLLQLSLGMAGVIGIQGCNLFSGDASIDGPWACVTTNQTSGQKNDDKFVFGPGNKFVMGDSQYIGVYERSGKSITLTILEIPELAKTGLSTSAHSVITGTVSKLTATELALDTVTKAGTKRSSVCGRPAPTVEQQSNPSHQTTAPQAQNLNVQSQPNQLMPILPMKSSDPKPMLASSGFQNIVAKKGTGVFELIGATQGLEELINTITKDKSSMFFSRLTGPSEDIVPSGSGGVFGKACMAHSCGDSVALYVRDNGAVALAYIDTNSDELHYFSNIDQKDGIPENLRAFIEETMKETPGLTLHGITTTNGVTKVPKVAVASPPQPLPPPVAQTEQRPPTAQPANQGRDHVAKYADGLAMELERASHPACRAIASNIRAFGNSGAPDYVRQRQIDSLIDKAPSICLGQ